MSPLIDTGLVVVVCILDIFPKGKEIEEMLIFVFGEETG